MRILFFIEGLGSGGKERRLIELIKGLSKVPNVDMTLVSTKNDLHYDELLNLRLQIVYLLRDASKKDITIFFKFYKIARKFRPQIIHTWGNLPTMYAIPTKIFYKVPLINNQIANAPKAPVKKSLITRINFYFSDRIVSNSIAGLKSYNPPKEKSAVIYNGFDFDRIAKLTSPASVRGAFDIKAKFVVGMVASFSVKKDYGTFIKAAERILNYRDDVTFLCIGGGDFNAFKKKISDQNSDRIKFLGKQSNVENIMNICHVGVLTTNADLHGEGISNAILEFMALGKPVIATNSGGTKELIETYRNGFLVPNEDDKELANKILEILSNSELLSEFGAFSRSIVKNKFSIDQMLRKFLNEYERCLNR